MVQINGLCEKEEAAVKGRVIPARTSSMLPSIIPNFSLKKYIKGNTFSTNTGTQQEGRGK